MHFFLLLAAVICAAIAAVVGLTAEAGWHRFNFLALAVFFYVLDALLSAHS